MDPKIYNIPSGYNGDLVPSDLRSIGGLVGIRPSFIEELRNDENGTSYLIRFQFVKSDDLKAADSVISDYRKLLLTTVEFDEFKAAIDYSRNGVVVFRQNQNNGTYQFEPARGFSMYNVKYAIEEQTNKRLGWFAKLMEIPNDLRLVVRELRSAVSELRLGTTIHKISFDSDYNHKLRNAMESMRRDLVLANDRYVRKCGDVVRLADRLRANNEADTALNAILNKEIAELKLHISNMEEDVLREAEKIKANIAYKVQQQQN
jgi:hypothetical protein